MRLVPGFVASDLTGVCGGGAWGGYRGCRGGAAATSGDRSAVTSQRELVPLRYAGRGAVYAYDLLPRLAPHLLLPPALIAMDCEVRVQ